ncbi:MAG: TolC family protein [Nitrospirae bacterium]|nr:TolC family protein [Nitrospirota bacterium]
MKIGNWKLEIGNFKIIPSHTHLRLLFLILIAIILTLTFFNYQPSFAQSDEGIVGKIGEIFSPPKIEETEKKAEMPIDIDSLSINESIAIALENSYILREAEDEIKRIKNKIGEETVWNWLRPNLSLKGGYDTEENRPEVSVSGGVDLRDIMGAGKKRVANLNLELKLAVAKIYRIKNSIANTVKRAYYDYQLSKEKVRIMEELILQGDELKGILEKGIKDGKVKADTILVISFTLNQNRMNLIAAKQDMIRAQMQFLEAMNIQ